MATNVIGKAVRGDNFFGRERELRALREASESAHVLLLAPRRVGKTSLLFATHDAERDARRVTPVFVSVASAVSEEDFVRLLIDAALATPIGKGFRRLRFARWRQRRRTIKAATVVGAAIELEPPTLSWQERADAALSQLRTAERPWLFLIDELPVVVLALAEADPSGARARAFLQWFRHVRQLPELAGTLRFVLAGSIGLDSLARRHAMTATINDLHIQRLGPFDDDTADRFIASLATSHGLALDAGLRRCVCDHVEWLIPYHLQGMVAGIRERGTLAPTSDDVARVVDGILDNRTYFDTWYERLQDAVGRADRDHAIAMLLACAVDPNGATIDTLRATLALAISDPAAREKTIAWILDVLMNDGYLVKEGERWRFRSGLLRRYWVRYFA